MAAQVSGPPTLAIVLDGAEPALVRRLMASGDLPVLASIAEQGSWSTVTSSAEIGSASVWPTFVSASEPHDHGIHYVWRWDPERMRIAREHAQRIVPWWRDAAVRGQRVLALDVPLLPFADVDGAVEVADWGAHDREGAVRARPERLVEEIAGDPGAHPYQREVAPPHDRPSARYLARSSARSCAGARMRGDLGARLLRQERPHLALIVFTETHRASHLLWQTVHGDDPMFATSRRTGLDDALVNVFHSVDASVGRIVEAAHPDARVLVFSLHGMRSCRGVPTLLHPLLVHLGFAVEPRGSRLSARDAGRMAFATFKEHSPQWVKTAWRRSVSPSVANAVAGPTALRPYDWARTRAFCLPTDQHGWIQINLEGREAAGIVPRSHYRGTCEELSEALLAARTTDGRPIVQRILRLADRFGGQPPTTLPDLVVHWHDAAHDVPVRIAGSDIAARPEGLRLTGKHAYEGFLATTGLDPPGPTVGGHQLHRVISSSGREG